VSFTTSQLMLASPPVPPSAACRLYPSPYKLSPPWPSQRLAHLDRMSRHLTRQLCANTGGSIPKRPIAKTAPKILISKKIVQNGPLHCPKWPIIQPKWPIAKSKTAHSYIQSGPLSLSAFGNIQSDLEILYVESSYTRSDLVKPATVAIDLLQT